MITRFLRKTSFWNFLFSTLLSVSYLNGDPLVFDPAYLNLSHTVGKGIGYDTGYTTVSATTFPSCCEPGCWAFADVRFHALDDGELASNAGIGLRHRPYSFERIFGVNMYYDFRHSNQGFNYNQLGFGIEILSCCYDFRINAYIPIHREKIIEDCLFDHYADGYVIRKREVENAFRGFNVEFGKSFCFTPCDRSYLAGGGYFFKENICHTSLGTFFRISSFIKKHLFIEGKISYDALFKTRIQGKIGLSIPLGRCSLKKINCLEYQPVNRDEIIVLDEFCTWKWNY